MWCGVGWGGSALVDRHCTRLSLSLHPPVHTRLLHVSEQRCSGNVHSQPDRLGHDLGPFIRPDKAVVSLHGSQRSVDGQGKKRDAKKAKLAARTLPGCARRAEGFLKTMKILKHKVRRTNHGSSHTGHADADGYPRARCCAHLVDLARLFPFSPVRVVLLPAPSFFRKR